MLKYKLMRRVFRWVGRGKFRPAGKWQGYDQTMSTIRTDPSECDHEGNAMCSRCCPCNDCDSIRASESEPTDNIRAE